MKLSTIAIVAFGIVAAGVYFDDNKKTSDIASSIRSNAVKIASNRIGWFDESMLQMKRSNLKNVVDRFKADEQSQIQKAFNSDAEAKNAVREMNKLQKAYEATKKAVNDFKGNSLEVSVGSGDNAATVNIKDESQKAILEAKLADIQAERDAAKAVVGDIRKKISDRITDDRPIEYTDAMEAFKKADEEYRNAVESNKITVSSLLEDDEWRHKEFVKEFQDRHTETEIIGKACVYSIIPVIALVIIWRSAFDKLTIMKEVI